MSSEYVKISDCKVGTDSDSGQAVMVFFNALEDDENDGWVWVPYSQIKSMVRSRTINGDEIEISRWLARKLNLA